MHRHCNSHVCSVWRTKEMRSQNQLESAKRLFHAVTKRSENIAHLWSITDKIDLVQWPSIWYSEEGTGQYDLVNHTILLYINVLCCRIRKAVVCLCFECWILVYCWIRYHSVFATIETIWCTVTLSCYVYPSVLFISHRSLVFLVFLSAYFYGPYCVWNKCYVMLCYVMFISDLITCEELLFAIWVDYTHGSQHSCSSRLLTKLPCDVS